MRNISKVIFADTENASTSPNISDDEASLVSMQQTPLRLHQALTQKEYSGAPKPSNEEGRMEFLCGLKVLDSAPERRYNRLTSTVAKVCLLAIPSLVVTVALSWHKRRLHACLPLFTLLHASCSQITGV
jgi:hypothetical protein